MSHSTVKYREDGHCRIVELPDCPDEESAIARSTEFADVCERIIWDEQARVVVLCFSGEATEHATEQPQLVEQTARITQPVIAVIRGNAIGYGLELALACDIRIAGEEACFGFPQVPEGHIPCHGGTQRLPRLIGPARAIEMILTGRLIDAAEACRIGLIHRAVAADALLSSAVNLAGEMAERSPLSLGYAKEALYGGRDLTLEQGLRMELDLYLLLFSTSDRVEGISAFREKRKPEFKGI